MTKQEFIAALREMADPSLEAYQKKIVSDTKYPMLCIRVPRMRALAKEAAKGEWREILEGCGWHTYEEVLTAGLITPYAKIPLEEKFSILENTVIPRLDSWAMTDTIVPTLKIKEAELPRAWEFANRCLEKAPEYTRRFGIVMMMDYFLTPEYIPQVAEKMTMLRDERYYVRMAAAWLLAEMAVHDCGRVMDILRSGVLDEFTHNMTIRKMRESYRISQDMKTAAAALKRKEAK